MSIGITNDEVEAFLTGQGITLGAGAGSAFISSCILAADAYLESELNRSYGVAGVASTRRFDGTKTPDLPIDDCSSISLVEELDTDGSVSDTIATTDYIAAPYNETAKNLLRKYTGFWNRGYGNYRITALWGRAAEDDVKDACTKKACLMILAGTNLPLVGGEVKAAAASYSTGAWSVDFKSNSDKNVVSSLTGWQADIDNVIRLRKKPRVF